MFYYKEARLLEHFFFFSRNNLCSTQQTQLIKTVLIQTINDEGKTDRLTRIVRVAEELSIVLEGGRATDRHSSDRPFNRPTDRPNNGIRRHPTEKVLQRTVGQNRQK